MFYEVKILNAKGDVKKIIPSSKLSKRYWDSVLTKETKFKKKKLIKNK